MKTYAIRHKKTPLYKTNRSAKRINNAIEQVLLKIVSIYKIDYDMKLFSLVYTYNTTFKIIISQSYYYLAYDYISLYELEMDL